MKIIISPAKKLASHRVNNSIEYSFPLLLSKSSQLVKLLKSYSSDQLGELMGISESLSELNFSRYKEWNVPFHINNSQPAIFAFKGDVYEGMDPESFSDLQLSIAQKRIRILSGLYGLLRPMDLMMDYRLEMGTKIKIGDANNLYDFWGSTISDTLKNDMGEGETLLNLASEEYSKAAQLHSFSNTVVTPVFLDFKNGRYKVISFFAKKARGYMCRYIIKNDIKSHNDLLSFDIEGYRYSDEYSKDNKPAFIRN